MTESNQPAQQPEEPHSVPTSAGQTDSGAREQGPPSPDSGRPDPSQGGSGQAGAHHAPAGLGDPPASFTPAQPQVPSPDAGQAQLGGSGPGRQFPPPGSGQPHPLGLGATTAQFGAEQPSGPFAGPHTGPQPTGQYYLPPGYQPSVPPRPKGRGKVVAGVAALVLLVGGLSGGLGGYLGYNFANDSSAVSSLDAPRAASQTGNAPAGSVEDVANRLLPSVVQIQVVTRTGAGEGSGFVISSNGQIVTNNHVIEGAATGGDIKVVFQDGRTASAKILGRDPSSDIAVIQADGISGAPVVQLGNSGDLKIGQGVVAIGSPFELSGTVTSGIVSSLNRPVSAGSDNRNSQATVLNAIQTDAAINPGNSGGPLVNMQGQVVGINSAIYSPSSANGQAGSVGIGFSIPMDQARRTIDEIVKTGKPKQTVLGVKVESTEQGAKISEITAGGAAEKAGLKAGDVITKFGDRRIDESDTLVAAVRSKAPGDKVTITLSDNRTVEATLDGVEVG
ncbi:S1C family serine protease [Lentzea sp.]|uniref:S1C family serine protease n=1 Tax=Lentzea sp. TaxID=56099 RepID=UPI002BCE1643|nr:trypsin-like peptidase domain-containing protein [Lentzea sp.]HUQ54959.1 trypsin-like peptidase domain-containing protein [Lentzea sp.]